MIMNIISGEVVNRTSTIVKPPFQVTSGEAISLFKAVSRSVGTFQAEVVNLQKAILKRLAIISLQAVHLIRAFPFRRAITQSEYVIRQSAINRTFSVSEGIVPNIRKAIFPQPYQVATPEVVNQVWTFMRGLSITQAQAFSLQKGLTKLYSVTTTEVVAIMRVLGKAFSTVDTQALSIQRAMARAYNITSLEAVRAIKATGKAWTVVSNEVVNAAKSVGKPFIVVDTEQVALSQKNLAKMVYVTSSETVLAIVRAGNKHLNLISAEAIGVLKASSRTYTIFQNQSSRLQKSVVRILGAGTAQVINRTAVAITRSISLISAEVANQVSLKAKLFPVSTSEAQVINTIRTHYAGYGVVVHVAELQVINRAVLVLRTISIVSAQIVSAARLFPLRAAAIQAEAVANKNIVVKVISIISAQSVIRIGIFAKFVFVSMNQKVTAPTFSFLHRRRQLLMLRYKNTGT
jgi:hypothetical protein